MLLIYTPKLTNRLGYTLNLVFRDILRCEFAITSDSELFKSQQIPKLCYAETPIGGSPFLRAVPLLFRTSIEEQNTHPFQIDGLPAIFPVYGQDLLMLFDPLAATFYIVSRYEEYLPHRKDMHGRFLAADSLASQHKFLDLPIVDHWALMLKAKILERYPDCPFVPRQYDFVQTIDIDAAYCYRHKGFYRTTLGLLRDALYRRDRQAVKDRWAVIRHKMHDPYDTFDYILEQSAHFGIKKTVFFALLGDYSVYDKPASYHKTEFRQLLQHLGDYAKVGIHPSYSALENPNRIDTESHRLEEILHRPIVRSRYHFLRLQMPQSYRALIHAGIRHDYSMGYAETIGFRAGTCSPHSYFDLERNHETNLTIHPFAAMDTSLQKYMKCTPEEAFQHYCRIIDDIRQVGGTFCAIWHNQNLCDSGEWSGWKELYEKVLEYAAPNNK